MQVWRSKNRTRHNELARQSHARNSWKHVGQRRENHLLKMYGITQNDYLKILKRQNGVN